MRATARGSEGAEGSSRKLKVVGKGTLCPEQWGP